MASIRRNTYKPDPYLAKAAENIAGLFAPPSGTDAAGWANANAKRAEAARIAELYAGAAGDTDRQAVMAGLYNPTQSYYAQNQNNATTIRGQDVTAATSRYNTDATTGASILNNQNTVKGNTISSLYGALNPGQVRPEVPENVASTIGLPTMAAAQGIPKPLSMDEVRAAALGQLPTFVQQQFALTGPGTQTVMRDGAPVVESNAGAIGLAPQPDPQKIIKPTNGQFSLNGRMGPAVQDVATGKWREAQTGAELPADAVISNLPTPQGSNAEVGLGKPAQNDIEKQLIDTAVAKDTAVTLRKLIAESPASQGIVGTLRGTAQNLLQSGGEVGNYFGGRLKAVDDAIKTGAADAGVAGAFDQNIPAIDMLSNLLAFQYAKTTTGERLSNEMLRNAKTALGLDGLDANQANSLARINQAIAAIERQEGILNRARGGGVAAISAPAPAAPVATSVAPAGGRMRFDANGNPL
jgi:hypothetical protein